MEFFVTRQFAAQPDFNRFNIMISRLLDLLDRFGVCNREVLGNIL